MEKQNHTMVSQFILLGLTEFPELQIFFFLFFSVIYMAIVLSNLIIIFVVKFDPQLHSPMYFLLANLSFIDMSLASFATPKMICDLISDYKTISYEGCMAQMFFLHLLGGSEMMLLVAMAIDRYIAICKPLHYNNIMSHRVCIGLALLSWTTGFVHTMSQMVFTVTLPFCGPNVVDSFFCDLPQVIKLACTDTYTLELLVIALSGLLSLLCFTFLFISYSIILITVRHHSSSGSSKALSTLSAHITVVVLFFGPCVFIYIWPFSSISIDKILSVFYTIFTPLLNPIIYTFRNKDMKKAIRKIKTMHVSPRSTF
ncbi:olfactory receptor 4K13-like [Equus quagga]|uniref:Olfactory receptor n=2 Tax=Equus TaxID=9789 RepID=F7DEG4_HORSE|nr:olfactory receptor family 4 subfamily K member 65 [Equus caballus]XP_008534391.1 PREDICTED: olfactory receptor 4K13-like [Equus przewalskii]XP_046510385.1 olfactory receptor 4K13-like [Equus quagga]